ncbi:helix-turn-helix transcriptional regulator [Vibrio sonorensis]|uniref:helix-turn-helix transcriptional regulator n=1 Tax=Vibrio sonorensis TaxID=1004316 RepID=UPI0008D9413A|nr:AraC family transcriptional regulator [Vibrio sonorensis]
MKKCIETTNLLSEPQKVVTSSTGLELNKYSPYREVTLCGNIEIIADEVEFNDTQIELDFESGFSIVIILESRFDIEINGKKLQNIDDNTLLVFHRGSDKYGSVKFKNNKKVKFVSIKFNNEAIDMSLLNESILEFGDYISGIDFTLSKSPLDINLYRMGKNIYDCQSSEKQNSAPKLLHDLKLTTKSLEIFHYTLSKIIGNKSNDIDSKLNNKIISAIKFIHEDLTKDWTYKSISQRVAISESEFRKKFRSMTCTTLGKYIEIVRLEKAGVLLSKGHNITSVSYEVGFSDPSYFTKRFKHHYKCTPKEFKQNNNL